MGEVMAQAMSTPFDLVLGRKRNLILTLLRHDLVDQFRLWVFPLLIGSGKRLFSEGTIPFGLELVHREVSTTGVTTGTNAAVGEIVTGSFALG